MWIVCSNDSLSHQLLVFLFVFVFVFLVFLIGEENHKESNQQLMTLQR
jgi:hypothetical protein